VLLHAVNERQRGHLSAHGWLAWALHGGEPVAFSWTATLAFLRSSTHPAVFPQPLSTARRWCRMTGTSPASRASGCTAPPDQAARGGGWHTSAVIVAGALLIFFGICFVVASMIFLVLRWGDLRLLSRMRRASRPSLGELATAAPLPRWVLVTGRSAPPPEGVLASPAFGNACVWYRTVVVEPGDEPPTVHVALNAGGPAISVADGTGSVQVDLGLVLKVSSHDRCDRSRDEHVILRRGGKPPDGSGLAALERAGLLPSTVYPRLWPSRRIALQEDTIAPGVELSVVARPRRSHSGAVVLQGRGAVSATTPRDWTARLKRDVVTAFWSTWGSLALGLTLVAGGGALIVTGVS